MMNVKISDWIHRRIAPALCTGSALQYAVMRHPDDEDARHHQEGDGFPHLTRHRDQRDPERRHDQPHDGRRRTEPGEVEGAFPGIVKIMTSDSQ
jgi:hypothetical protein